jgi:DNA-binding NarL/FixJ family response regulator
MKARKTRILIADDNPDIRSAMALLLETRLNAQIIGEADSMESLLSILKTDQPDMVILDWELPGTPAGDRVALLKGIHPILRVVATTSQPENAQKNLGGQADAYLSKSELPERIVWALQSICDFKGEKLPN